MAKHHYINESRILADMLPTIGNGQHKTVTHAYFASISDCATYVESKPKSAFWTSYYIEDAQSEQCGGLTFKAAIDMARTGWLEGAARVAAIRDRINATTPQTPKMIRWDVAGAIPSVPRYLAGNPLAMRRSAPADTRRKPIITLIANITGSWSIPTNYFVNRAAVIAATVDAIESAGFSVHLIAADITSGKHDAAEIAATIKNPGEHCDVAQLAYGVGHPAFFRRLFFAVQTSDKAFKPIGFGLGSVQSYGPRQDGCLVLPNLNAVAQLFATEDSAATVGMAETVRELARQGCPAFRDHEAFNRNA